MLRLEQAENMETSLIVPDKPETFVHENIWEAMRDGCGIKPNPHIVNDRQQAEGARWRKSLRWTANWNLLNTPCRKP